MQEGLRSRANNSLNNKRPSQKEASGSIASDIETPGPPAPIEKTDYSLWRLQVLHGRQTWHYITPDQAKSWPQSVPEKYHLGLETGLPNLDPPKTIRQAARNGLEFYAALQTDDGHWACEYGGPMFLIPGLIIAMYISATPIPESWRVEITRYLCNMANPKDGGWGVHTHHKSTAFGTVMNYVVLRLLGMDPEHHVAVKARSKIHELGGAIGVPHWGKFWLSALGIYEWEGINPIPPELWLLPDWFPIHPHKWWIHVRNVYIPMSYIFRRRLSHPLTPLTKQIRDEIYTEPYSSYVFSQHRNTIAEGDIYNPHTRLLDVLNWIVTQYEKYLQPTRFSDAAVARVWELICHEDDNTDFLCVGPVNNAVHLLAVYHAEGRESYRYKRHVERLADFMWLGKDGMMMNGTNGVQLWDTAFTVAAVFEADLAAEKEFIPVMTKALEFLDDMQIPENVPKEAYRHQRKGAWPFSTRHQGYTVSDCTAEGLRAVLLLQNHPSYPTLIPASRLQDAVDVLLSLQNPNGGFASYELARGGEWMEWINPAEVFGRIMVEYCYPECTTASITALIAFQKHDSTYRSKDIQRCVSRAVKWVKSDQRKDGSWYGSWGICFTYAGMFAMECLSAAGETYENSDHQKRACEFLVSKQRHDGGWGESYLSCELGVWTENEEGSQVVNSAFAILGLMYARYPRTEVIRKGIMFLIARQRENGEWLQETIEGVFNKNCMISYPNYKFCFPIKALGMYAHLYGNEEI